MAILGASAAGAPAIHGARSQRPRPLPANVSTRLARGRLRIPAGKAWTFAIGIEPEFMPEGKR